MSELGYLGALLGGVIALASPCGALLLPAFFAYAFPRPTQLLGRTAIFYAGLAAVLVPLGMGSAQASRLVYGHQAALTTGAGVLLVGLGLVQLGRAIGRTDRDGPPPDAAMPRSAGRSPVRQAARTAARLASLPRTGLASLRVRLGGDSAPAVFVLGAVSGLGGFCSGPILGGVLTLAAASGTTSRGAALLAVFAAGMTVPLLVLAVLWERYDLGRRGWLRAGIRIGRFRVAVAALLSGVVFCGLGALFLYFRGAAGLTGLFQPAGLVGWETRLQTWVARAQAYVPDLALLAALALVVLAVTAWKIRHTR